MVPRNNLHDVVLYKSGLRALLGGCTDMKIHRLLHDSRAQFPRPSFIGRRPWWWRGEVIEWLETKAALTKSTKPQGYAARPAARARRRARGESAP
jgi:predicted DNA-binding transcriptional regulator AlpA